MFAQFNSTVIDQHCNYMVPDLVYGVLLNVRAQHQNPLLHKPCRHPQKVIHTNNNFFF